MGRRKKTKEPESHKQLRIKLSICKRHAKDIIYYGKEIAAQKAKIEKMREDGKDVHDIRKQTQVLEESEDMLPRISAQLSDARSELAKFLVRTR